MRVQNLALAVALATTAMWAHAAPTPPNNFGIQDTKAPPSLQVVYPSLNQIVEAQVSDTEDTQLTPDQVKRIKELGLNAERQRATPYTNLPKPITRTLAVNLDPGIAPPVIRLARGQLSSMVFSDAAGSPWFIESIAMNRSLFSDGRADNAKDQAPTNVLTIEPLTTAAYGNVTVQLKGLNTPVIFVLSTAQKEVDMRVDAKIPGRNPDGYVVSEVSDLPKMDDALTLFLDNVPPRDARRLRVSGMEGVAAWFYQDSLYLRAKGEAQYPAYLSAAKSTSGMSVYKFSGAHNSVTLLSGGRAVTIFIE